MNVPFRRSQPAAWGLRLGQVTRGASRPEFEEPAPPPEPGGTLLSLTLQPPPLLTVTAIEADPVGAQRLPPAELVGVLLDVAEENRALEKKLKHRSRKLSRLQARLEAIAVDDAETRGRLAALEQVIAALHANVEDLRLERDRLLADR